MSSHLKEAAIGTSKDALRGSTPGHIEKERSDGMPHVDLPLAGTRTGWPMRLTYLAADLTAIAIAFTVAYLTGQLLWKRGFPAPGETEVKSFGMLGIGLLTASVMHGSYAAIPPRPVRQFRAWFWSAVALCGTEIGILWLFDQGELALYTTLSLATAIAMLLASFLAPCAGTGLAQPDGGVRA